MRRVNWVVVVALYLAVGLVLGLIMESAVPAMNALGVAYYALTWPLWLLGFNPTIPTWMFTFDGGL
jgi:hypothetical protein